jgi:hypothetical protein
MFKSIGASIGAFLSDPLKFLADPANATIEYQTKKMAAEGRTAVEIDEALKQSGLKQGAGPVKAIIDGAAKIVQFLLDNLPRILLLFVILMCVYFALKFAKVLK